MGSDPDYIFHQPYRIFLTPTVATVLYKMLLLVDKDAVEKSEGVCNWKQKPVETDKSGSILISYIDLNSKVLRKRLVFRPMQESFKKQLFLTPE